jgi:hypothetical protein
MAFVVCPKHGGHGAAAVCSHVAAVVAAQIPLDGPLYPVSASYAGQALGPTWLCTACARGHHVPEGGLELTGEESLERLWTEIGFTPVCPRCLESVRQPNA